MVNSYDPPPPSSLRDDLHQRSQQFSGCSLGPEYGVLLVATGGLSQIAFGDSFGEFGPYTQRPSSPYGIDFLVHALASDDIERVSTGGQHASGRREERL